MRFLWILVMAVIAASCASRQPEPCNSLACLHDQARQEIAEACTHDLWAYPPRRQDAIDAEYKYPLTNHDTYSLWVRMGHRGPSPWEWCRSYAKVKYTTALSGGSARSSGVMGLRSER